MVNVNQFFDVEVNWLISAFRLVFAFFDWILYGLMQILFRTIFHLANFELVGLYEFFEERVYVVLGIFMLFKVTISLITYLVNPDKITDKEQGATKIVTRIITVLVMLIALPTFFDLMTEFQNKLLPVIPRVIVGTANTLESDDVTGIAQNMSLTMLQGFAQLKDGCNGTEISNVSDFLTNINNVCSDTQNTYAYNYLPVISTITGLVACYVIFSLAISVAIRTFKLIILRMIAPVPVISYIDPKSAKDGAFSHWSKTFISTWGELFVNLGIIYFIIRIIDFILSAEGGWQGFFDGLSGPWAIIDGPLLIAFLIIGLLMFAKQAPQFIFDALGIKNKGNFMRMLGMGATALGGIGSARAAFDTRRDRDFREGKGDQNRLKNIGASLFNGLASVANGGNALLTSDKGNPKAGYDAQAKYNAQNLRRIDSGSTLGGRLLSMGSGLVGGQTPAEKMKLRNQQLESANKAFKDYKSTVESRFDGDDNFGYSFTLTNEDGSVYFTSGDNKINWLRTERLYSAAQNGDENAKIQLAESIMGREDICDDNGNVRTNVVNNLFNKLRDNYDAVHKEGYKAFANEARSGNGDSVVYGKLVELQDAVKGIEVDVYDSNGKKDENAAPVMLSSMATGEYGTSKKAMGNISGTQRAHVLSDKYKAAMADDKETKKGS